MIRVLAICLIFWEGSIHDISNFKTLGRSARNAFNLLRFHSRILNNHCLTQAKASSRKYHAFSKIEDFSSEYNFSRKVTTPFIMVSTQLSYHFLLARIFNQTLDTKTTLTTNSFKKILIN